MAWLSKGFSFSTEDDKSKKNSTPSLLTKEFDNNIEPEKSLSLALRYNSCQFPLTLN